MSTFPKYTHYSYQTAWFWETFNLSTTCAEHLRFIHHLSQYMPPSSSHKCGVQAWGCMSNESCEFKTTIILILTILLCTNRAISENSFVIEQIIWTNLSFVQLSDDRNGWAISRGQNKMGPQENCPQILVSACKIFLSMAFEHVGSYQYLMYKRY